MEPLVVVGMDMASMADGSRIYVYTNGKLAQVLLITNGDARVAPMPEPEPYIEIPCPPIDVPEPRNRHYSARAPRLPSIPRSFQLSKFRGGFGHAGRYYR